MADREVTDNGLLECGEKRSASPHKAGSSGQCAYMNKQFVLGSCIQYWKSHIFYHGFRSFLESLTVNQTVQCRKVLMGTAYLRNNNV